MKRAATRAAPVQLACNYRVAHPCLPLGGLHACTPCCTLSPRDSHAGRGFMVLHYSRSQKFPRSRADWLAADAGGTYPGSGCMTFLAWEKYRLEAMFKPVIMAMPTDESGLRQECQKTPGAIVWVTPPPKE
jgi:hypothetical protein